MRSGDFGRLRVAAKIFQTPWTGDVFEAGGEFGSRGRRVGPHPGDDDAKDRAFAELAFDSDLATQQLA